jgi:hypothetical protein
MFALTGCMHDLTEEVLPWMGPINTPLILFIGTLFASPVSCVLTDPGSFCPGDMTTLTCNVTGGVTQRWLYNTMPIGNSILPVDALPMSDRVDGVDFTLLLLSTMNSPYLASQISFVATERMDGRIVECRTSFPRMSNAETVIDMTTLRVGSGSECRHSLGERKEKGIFPPWEHVDS